MTDAPALSFADQGRAGRHRIWWWGLGLVAIFVLVTGLVLAVVFAANTLFPDALLYDTDHRFVAATLVSLALITPVCVAVVRIVHGRPARTLFTAAARFRWSLVGLSTAVAVALVGLAQGLEILAVPGDLETAGPNHVGAPVWLAFVPLVFLQCLGEESLFRGYLVQAVGRFTRRTWLVVALPAGLFFAAHIPNVAEMSPIDSPVFWEGLIDYLIYSVYVTWITVRTGGIEAALGLHVGTNLFLLLVAEFALFRIDRVTLFTWTPDPDHALLNAVVSLVLMGAVLAAHWALVVRRRMD